MKAALLLVDLQRDYLATPQLRPTASALVARATGLLAACRERHIPIIHVWTTVERSNDRRLPHWREADRWICVAGTTGHEPPESLRPLNGEAIIHKTGFNPFAQGNLENHLRAAGRDTVILAGLHLNACVRTAAVECLERGFRVLVAEDVVASNDPIHAAATRRWLADRCVAFESSSAVCARVDGSVPSGLVHRSPRHTGEVLFEVPISSDNEVADATAAAKTAWKQWQRIAMPARLNILDEIAGRLEAVARDFATEMAIEIGKPVSHGLEEVRRAAANIRDVAQRAATQSQTSRQSAGFVRHQPLGVVGVISPWNNPVAIPIGKIVPALAYGNTVVWKPAPAGTRVAHTLLRLLHESGAPANVVQLVTGDHNTAQRIAADENINAVTLTGSVLAGYAIQEICSRRIVPLQAELSGNNAAIVWDDAGFSHAAAQVAWGAFAFAGQRCTANRRVIIHASCYEDFLRELEIAASRLTWGDPLATSTEIGPVINTEKRDELAGLVATTEASGAAHRVVRLHEDHAKQSWVRAGAYAQPVIACCDMAEHALVQEETMSPLLVVQRAEDFDHALALCNGVRQGLVSALFSNSSDLRQRFLEQAQAGVLKFNESTAGVDVALPFGGWKASGLGPPEHGEGDRLFYAHMQAVYNAVT